MKALLKSVLRKAGYVVYRPAADVGPSPSDVCRSMGVREMRPMELAAYRSACPPLFPEPAAVPLDIPFRHYRAVDEALHNQSMSNYFRVARHGDRFLLTDDYENAHYYSRQRMLQTVYQDVWDGRLNGASVLDIGCSSGYYSFYCARAGASEVTGIDARPEHEDQFRLLHRMLNMPATCRYRHVDMERELETLAGPYDLVLAQGVLYHVYDHPRFLKNVARFTKNVLILEGECSGTADHMCRAVMEPVESLRASIHGPVIYPSLRWMIELVKWVGFRDVAYMHVPAEVPDDWGFGKLRRAMLVCFK